MSIVLSCNTKKEVTLVAEKNSITKPKNIILLVGDGMGLSQVSASQFYNKSKSNFERFPVIGLIKTSSASELITDSASSATAFASGIKTYNGALGVNSDTTISQNYCRGGLRNWNFNRNYFNLFYYPCYPCRFLYPHKKKKYG